MRILTALLVLFLAAPAAADQGLAQRLAGLDARVAASPGDIELLLTRADLRVRAGQPIGALADLAVVAEQESDEPRMLLIRATVHELLGSSDLALADLDRRIGAGPPSARAHDLRARLRERGGDLQAALDDALAALRLAPSPERSLTASRLVEQSDGPLAAAELSSHWAEELRGAVALRLEGLRLFRAAQRPDLALVQIEALLAASPAHPDWMLLKADVLDEAGRSSSARRVRVDALDRLDQLLLIRSTPARRTARARLAAQLGVSE